MFFLTAIPAVRCAESRRTCGGSAGLRGSTNIPCRQRCASRSGTRQSRSAKETSMFPIRTCVLVERGGMPRVVDLELRDEFQNVRIRLFPSRPTKEGVRKLCELLAGPLHQLELDDRAEADNKAEAEAATLPDRPLTGHEISVALGEQPEEADSVAMNKRGNYPPSPHPSCY